MNQHHNRYTCCVISDSFIAVAVVQRLIQSNMEVVTLFCDNNKLAEWAGRNNISVLPISFIKNKTNLPPDIDFLFSIFNPIILKSDVLRVPRIAAVNYHDSYLPEYRGYNSTAWAILNRESYHGYTWHIMDADIDTGPIIKQRKVKINAKDTAMSLSLKCYEAGLKGLPEVIHQLTRKVPHYITQPESNSEEVIHKKFQTILGLGLVNWYWSAEEIHRMYRALSFSDYDNTIATPKLILENSTYILDRLDIQKATKQLEPGTIVSLRKNIVIATRTNYISISSIRDVYGNYLSLKSIIESHHLVVGQNISINNLPAALRTYESAIIPQNSKEYYWVNRLGNKDFQFLGLNEALSRSGDDLFNELAIDIPHENVVHEKFLVNQNTMLTLLILFLYRTNNYKNLILFIKTPETEKISDSVHYEQYLPLVTELEPQDTFAIALEKIDATLKDMLKHLPMLKTMCYRYQRLQHLNPASYIHINMGTPADSEQYNNLFAHLDVLLNRQQNTTIKISGKAAQTLKYYEPYIRQLITSVSEDNQKKLHEFTLFPPGSLQKNNQKYKAESKAYDQYQSISTLLTKVAQEFPDKIAIICAKTNKKYTYKELEANANSAAVCLQQLNTCHSRYIGILMNTQPSAITIMIATQKMGCAYLPLLTSYPLKLLKETLIEAGVKIIIVDPHIDPKQMELFMSMGIVVVNFKDLLGHIPTPEQLASIKHKDNLDSISYVMYTSGSEGRPKGVIVKQKGIFRLVKDTNYIDIRPSDTIAQTSSLSFDAATFTVWGALLNGATLLILSKESLLDTQSLKRLILKYNISIMWLTARVLDLHYNNDQYFASALNYLLAGGDVLSLNVINGLNDALRNSTCKIINGYGPTENTTFTTTYEVQKGMTYHNRIPIGKPLVNSACYVLDPFTNPVPDGIIGELYVGGDGLSAGYLDSDLNAGRFVNLTDKNQEYHFDGLLYRTGDLVKWGNGHLEYIGRADSSQLKVRGFRIELDSISNTIEQMIGVHKCEVIIDKEVEKIIACVVLNANIDIKSIKKLSQENLAKHMVPDEFIQLKQLPLNKNGKTDKGVLISLYKSHIQKDTSDYTDEVLSMLVKIWSELLNIDSVDPEDNFFDVGGHSLLVMQLLQEIKKQFKRNVSIAEFLDNPTIQHLHNMLKFGRSRHFKQKIFKKIQEDINECILPDVNVNPIDGEDILLTGVTGFLGAYLLESLLSQTRARIYCIVRSHLSIDELIAMKTNLNVMPYNLRAVIRSRVRLLVGDIAKEHLGLSEKTYFEIANSVKSIYHSAANVNHIYSYLPLRQANVLGTYEILKFANTTHRKSLYFISTLSAVVPNEANIREEILVPTNINDVKKLQDGYSQTKWVCEEILKKAIEQGHDIKIFRPGWILGSNIIDDMPNFNHFLCLLKTCIQLGAAPSWEDDIHFLPVNFVAKAIISISTKRRRQVRAFNLTNLHKLSWRKLINFMIEYGYEIRLVPVDNWKQEYLPKVNKDIALFPFIELYLNDKYGRTKSPDGTGTSIINDTVEALHHEGILMPEITDKIVFEYIASLERSHFFPPPTQIRTDTSHLLPLRKKRLQAKEKKDLIGTS